MGPNYRKKPCVHTGGHISCMMLMKVFQSIGTDDVLDNFKFVNFNTLPEDKILDWSKLKQIADDMFKCI